MKITYRVPTQDPYAFVEIEMDAEPVPPEAIHEEYEKIKAAFRIGEGLSEKVIDAFLEEYLSTGTVMDGTELYAEMSKEQQKWVQCIKRTIKRINKS